MRVMLLIQRFPPHHIGGYELRFMDIAAGLRRRGHDVSVVTSTFGVARAGTDDRGVHRILTLVDEVYGLAGIARLIATTWSDGRRLRRTIRIERPDVILVGNLCGLSSGLWNVLHRSSARLVLDVSNDWLLDLATTHGNWFRIWTRPSRSPLRRLVQSALRRCMDAVPGSDLGTTFPQIGADRIYVTSLHQVTRLRSAAPLAGIPIDVCPSGIELDAFRFEPRDRAVRRLLYVGRLKRLKGVHTAIAALRALPATMVLTIVGVPDDAEYERSLRAAAAEFPGRVTFRGPVERVGLPGVFRDHDLLVFPTEGEEAFSRLILEAQACGLPVVATATGGTPAAIEGGVNGLLVAPGNAAALSAAVLRIAQDNELRARVVTAGRRQVEHRFGLDAAIARVERVLLNAVEAPAAADRADAVSHGDRR